MENEQGPRIQLDEKLCRQIVRQTVEETLSGIGFDMNAPNQLQADMYYLRKLRNGSEDMMRVVRRSAITVGFSTSLFLMWEAVRGILQR